MRLFGDELQEHVKATSEMRTEASHVCYVAIAAQAVLYTGASILLHTDACSEYVVKARYFSHEHLVDHGDKDNVYLGWLVVIIKPDAANSMLV